LSFLYFTFVVIEFVKEVQDFIFLSSL